MNRLARQSQVRGPNLASPDCYMFCSPITVDIMVTGSMTEGMYQQLWPVQIGDENQCSAVMDMVNFHSG